jgi:hypothetical protein
VAKGGGNQVITDLILNISANSSELRTNLDRAQNNIKNFTSKLTSIAGAVGVAFGVQEVLNFGLEISKLAGEFDGVQNAFKKLPASTKLLIDLKEATQGTVSELNLMKRAVQFNNFGLSLEQLPKLLEFATKRAQATGQSVDYLVDSIVTGLGRKSVLILDNLGISSQQLNAEIEKTGDFFGAVGTIVDKELTKMGSTLETNVTKTARLSASWENFKVSIGQAANGTGVLGHAIDQLSQTLDTFGGNAVSWKEKLAALSLAVVSYGGSIIALNEKARIAQKEINATVAVEEQKKQAQVIREVDRAYVEFNKNIEAYGRAITTHIYKTELLAEFQKRLNAEFEKEQKAIRNIANLTEEMNALVEKQKIQTGAQLAATNAKIQAYEKEIKTLQELGKETGEYIKVMTKLGLKAVPVATPKGQSLIKKETKDDKKKKNTSLGEIAPVGNVDGLQLAPLTEQTQILYDLWTQFGDYVTDLAANQLPEAFNAMGAAFVGVMDDQRVGLRAFVSDFLRGINSIVNALLAKAIAGVIAGESSKGLPGLILAAVGIGAIRALFAKNVDVPKGYAKGGYMPNNSDWKLVGENGPELVRGGGKVYTNNRTKNMLANATQRIEVVGVMRGSDIYLVNAEQSRIRQNSF